MLVADPQFLLDPAEFDMPDRVDRDYTTPQHVDATLRDPMVPEALKSMLRSVSYYARGTCGPGTCGPCARRTAALAFFQPEPSRHYTFSSEVRSTVRDDARVA
jgi:hypothetical protein